LQVLKTVDLEEFERKVRSLWHKLSPDVDGVEEELLLKYLELGAATPYRVARILNLSAATAYRRSRSLLEKRLLVPGNEGKLVASVKGCIVLYSRGRVGLESLVSCAQRIWGLPFDAEALLGFIYLLGLEAEKRRLTVKTLTMCRVDEASIHVLRYLKEAIVHHVASGSSFAEALDEVAMRYCVPPNAFREAIRLALRGAATTLPLSVTGAGHRIVALLHDRAIYHFVIECENPCEEYRRSLGLECPRAAEAVRARLARLLGTASGSASARG